MMRGIWTHEENSIVCLDYPKDAGDYALCRKLEAASGFEPLHRSQKTENNK